MCNNGVKGDTGVRKNDLHMKLFADLLPLLSMDNFLTNKVTIPWPYEVTIKISQFREVFTNQKNMSLIKI